MALGEVNIAIENGALNNAPLSEEGISGMVLTGTAIAGKLNLGESTTFYSLADAKAKGITELSNLFAYRQIKAFYDMAGDGAELWLMLVDSVVKQSQMVNGSNAYLKKLKDDSKGRIRLAAVSQEITTAPVANEGVIADAVDAIAPAQALVDSYAVNHEHLHVILDGANFNGEPADLDDITTQERNRVSVLTSNTNNSRNADVGLLLGRLASDPVQRMPSRVKTGRVSDTAYFGLGHSAESMKSAYKAIAKKGYIFLRAYTGKAGYYFSDASTCAPVTDDYNQIPRGRVMDKAVRLAYSTYVDEIHDEIEPDDNGGISPIVVKAWERKIEKVLEESMRDQGEISKVDVFIDSNQDILGTDTIQIVLKIQPKGYASIIEIKIGFTKKEV